jgi:hypothetical protein
MNKEHQLYTQGWQGHVSRMGEMKKALVILVEKLHRQITYYMNKVFQLYTQGWPGHVSRMGEMKRAFVILAEKLYRKFTEHEA